MKTWLENKWDNLRTNFWFVPFLMAFAAVFLCLAFLHIDRITGFAIPGVGKGNLESIRSLLSVLIGAIVTALSIVFSSTVVVLTLAASQLGPRLLRTYMRARSNQLLIGIFIAALFYNLVALFIIGRLEGESGIPNITVLGSFALSVATLIMLTYFIHHVARNIQAPNVILSVSNELKTLILKTYPQQEDIPESFKDTENWEKILPEKVNDIKVSRTGYIQAVNETGLLQTAVEEKVIIRTIHRPGDFVTADDVIAYVYADHVLEEDKLSRFNNFFFLGENRTATQDVEFVMNELVEIALRALSPSINDPFTANTCIDRLAEGLTLVSGRVMPDFHKFDAEGNLRIILDQTGFKGLCKTAFYQIRQHGADNVAVLIHLLESIGKILKKLDSEEYKLILWDHVQMIKRTASRLPEPEDKKDLELRIQELGKLIKIAK
ncbi:MAG: hypothetical protein APR54_12815 [Candidatus Cloacimonas sp. SDB]|nr:MAG: hypothetical protein APR54_12815 [Candidatus Cloacimonas sp. SDB]